MSRGVQPEEKAKILSKFMFSMKISGYDTKYRLEILKAALNIEEKEEEEILKGTRVRYRTRKEIEEMKSAKPGNSSNTWFLTGTNTTVCNVPCTPGSKLAASMKCNIGSLKAPDKGTTKIVELAGKTISTGLSVPDPFKSNDCPFPKKCQAGCDVDCTQGKIVYQVDCKKCQEQGVHSEYYGTSGHNLHKRMGEHFDCVRNKNFEGSALAKHVKFTHPDLLNNDPNTVYDAKILSSNFRHNVTRYVTESLQINQANNDTNISLMNGKNEWGNKRVRRLRAT